MIQNKKQDQVTFEGLVPPTPPEVIESINTIAAYLRERGWVEAIISDSGGASFYLMSVYEFILDKGAQATETVVHDPA